MGGGRSEAPGVPCTPHSSTHRREAGPARQARPGRGLTWALVVASSAFLSSRTRMNRGKRREIPFSPSTWGRGR